MIWQPCPICDFPFEENDPAFLAHIDSHYSSELAAVTDKCAPLTSFHTSSAQDDTVETDDPFRTCPYCGNFLAGNSFQEHVDLHAAEEEAANYEAKTREDEQLARTLQAEQEDMTRQDADLARVLQGAQGDTVCRQDEELARALEAEDLQATTHTSQSTSTGMKRRGSDSVINESAINAKRQSVSHTSHTFTIPRFMPDNGSTRTDGIIPLLRSLLVTTAQGSPRSKKENHTRRAWLCREGVVHYRAGPQDSGWGCGYRNFQMLLSALSRIREYNATLSRMLYAGLNHGEGRAHVPDVSTIQEMIEAGWTAGFDAAGARQLGHKLTGTKKWIGTTEVASCLRYYYVRAKVYDFHRPTGPAGAHPKLVDFVEEYFCGRVGAANGGEGLGESVKGKEAGKVWDWKSRRAEEMRLVVSDKPPLYFQHQGHSRTIIGIEILNSGKRNLLCLDPGKHPLPLITSSSSSSSSSLTYGHATQVLDKFCRVAEEGLKVRRQYQILRVDEGVVEGRSEWEGGRVVRGIRVPGD